MSIKSSIANSVRRRVLAAIIGGTTLGGGITAVVTQNEGFSGDAYLDSAGVPTICYGETKGVKLGQSRSLSECKQQLIESVGAHSEALVGLPVGLPDVVVLGSIDMAYNVGVYGFRNSKVHRLLTTGDYKAAGKAVLEWRYISSVRQPKGPGWVYVPANKKWRYDCSQLVSGKPNKVCWGVWKRRQWESKTIGNEFRSVQEAVRAL
ncbi:endolysin [Shigella phage Buco]|uniref:Lysozyme n=1 Tax=Shigella phage Buco TaxID=2530183 RepID=A0A482JGS4_9CAUD|nr:endolysin [Shigella phage Buco]QBP32951.1 endolysin [Shigella phage Buco]